MRMGKTRGKLRPVALGLITAFLVAGIALIVAGPYGAGKTESIINDALASTTGQAPDFELKDMDGKTVKLSQFKGKKPVLLYFWATWCPSCTKAQPAIIEIYNSNRNENLEVFGVNVGQGDPVERVKRFLSGHPVPFPVLYDNEGKVSSSYSVSGIPLFVLVNKEGKIVYRDNRPPRDVKRYLQ